MQHDEMIWQVINHQFCSYKTKIGVALSEKRDFCKHPYSITGLCNRSSCPLANSKYATIREEEGRIHLYLKTVERAHSPKNLWEKIYLSRNYGKAMSQLDEHLAYFPKSMIHRNKQRLTKIHQYLLRMRKIKLKELAGRKAKMTRVHRKVEQREERREKKALVAAKIENGIEKELMERLARGTYGDIYNFPEVPYQKALDEYGQEVEMEEESEMESDEESEEEEEEGRVEYVEDLEEEDEEEDMEDMQLNVNPWNDEDDDDDDDEESDESSDDSDNSEASESGSDDGSSDTIGSGDSNRDSDESDEEGSRKKKTKKPSAKKKPPKRKGTRIEIEYEDEETNTSSAIMEDAGENTSADAGMTW